MTKQLVRVQRPPGDRAEPLARAFATLAQKSGVVTPEQAARDETRRARQRAVDDRRRAEVLAKAYRDACGVWPRYEKASLDDVGYAAERLSKDEFARYCGVRDDLRTVLAEPGILVLSGDNGPGKTHLACALVHACCEEGRSARWIRASDFFLELKSTFGERGHTQTDLIRRFENYSLLVVDEIEVRSDSNWENNCLRALIDARYGRVLATVLVTNKTKAELNGEDGSTPYLSRALRDRIRQEGGILECKWRSLRGEAR